MNILGQNMGLHYANSESKLFASGRESVYEILKASFWMRGQSSVVSEKQFTDEDSTSEGRLATIYSYTSIYITSWFESISTFSSKEKNIPKLGGAHGFAWCRSIVEDGPFACFRGRKGLVWLQAPYLVQAPNGLHSNVSTIPSRPRRMAYYTTRRHFKGHTHTVLISKRTWGFEISWLQTHGDIACMRFLLKMLFHPLFSFLN